MRLASFSVNKLFGTFDHTINFNPSERIKILHGPNGFGKTSILRLIDAFFKSKYQILRRIPYERLSFSFDDNSTVEVVRKLRKADSDSPGHQRVESPALEFTLRKAGYPPNIYEIPARRLDRERVPLSAIDDIIPVLSRIGPEQWIHDLTGRQFSLNDVLEEFADQIPQFAAAQKAKPEWLKLVLESLPVYLIETQRLLLTSKDEKPPHMRRFTQGVGMSSAVSVYSKEMIDRVRETLAKSAEASQSLDSSFPKRLLQGSGIMDAGIDEIRTRYERQVEKRTRLMAAGLLDREEEFPLPEKSINDAEKHVLALYVKDVEEKLAVFDDILKRIELFKEMVNRRFQYKKLRIDRKEGFIFEIPQGGLVPPTELSSGEQHEIVLAHKLLFNVPEGALILIDEPELSLHVAWQQDFLKDMENISSVIKMDYLIATHSPQIIDGRWDLTTALEGPSQ